MKTFRVVVILGSVSLAIVAFDWATRNMLSKRTAHAALPGTLGAMGVPDSSAAVRTKPVPAQIRDDGGGALSLRRVDHLDKLIKEFEKPEGTTALQLQQLPQIDAEYRTLFLQLGLDRQAKNRLRSLLAERKAATIQLDLNSKDLSSNDTQDIKNIITRFYEEGLKSFLSAGDIDILGKYEDQLGEETNASQIAVAIESSDLSLKPAQVGTLASELKRVQWLTSIGSTAPVEVLEKQRDMIIQGLRANGFKPEELQPVLDELNTQIRLSFARSQIFKN